MPAVKKLNPLADSLPENMPSESVDPNLEVIVTKLEEAFARLNSLKEPLMALDSCIKTLQSFSERLEEVEKGLSGLDLGKAPAIPGEVYDGLTPSDVFKSSLHGLLVASLTTHPTILGSKPELQAAHLRRVIDLAFRTMSVATERMPKLVKAEA